MHVCATSWEVSTSYAHDVYSEEAEPSATIMVGGGFGNVCQE